MKKFLKTISVNILLFFLLFTCSEFIIYTQAKTTYERIFYAISKNIPAPGFLQTYSMPFQANTIQAFKDRQLRIRPFATNKNNGKKPILIFGCSYANGGNFLKDEQTVGYKLSKYSNRNVYNFGICSCGIQHMLYIIENLLDKYVPSENFMPEYAVYIYIPNHIQRLKANISSVLFDNGINLQYELKNDGLKQKDKTNSFIYRIFTVKLFYYILGKKYNENNEKNRYKNFELANELFKESKKELEKRYPGIKFVIINYQTENDDNVEREEPFMFDVLRNEGFIVLNSEELIGRKFRYDSEDTVQDKYHPSEYAWDLLVPALIKKSGL